MKANTDHFTISENNAYKAGIREVVEEITNAMDTAKVGYFAATVEKCLQDWQAKLKEWGA